MKKLNKKGFTLVELLVVVIILGVIMSIAIPSITSSVERSKEKQKKQIENIVLSAAKIYVSDHEDVSGMITLDRLYCSKLITREDIVDPFNKNKTICGYVISNRQASMWVEVTGSTQYCLPSNIDCNNISN